MTSKLRAAGSNFRRDPCGTTQYASAGFFFAVNKHMSARASESAARGGRTSLARERVCLGVEEKSSSRRVVRLLRGRVCDLAERQERNTSHPTEVV
jgi:hypothetical protein